MGCEGNQGIITTFFADESTHSTPNSYIPDIRRLNQCIDEWSKRNIVFCGIIHSHLVDKKGLSEADIIYAKKILYVFGSYLWFPVAVCVRNHVQFYFYKGTDEQRYKYVDVSGNDVLEQYQYYADNNGNGMLNRFYNGIARIAVDREGGRRYIFIDREGEELKYKVSELENIELITVDSGD